MGPSILPALGRFVTLHPGLTDLCVFLAPIGVAYGWYALRPYRRPREQSLLTPGRAAQPAVPGVLERYAAWELTQETGLTPFGRWLQEELSRQHLTLADLARASDVEREALLRSLYPDRGRPVEASVIRAVAGVLGADEAQIERLQQAEGGIQREMQGRP